MGVGATVAPVAARTAGLRVTFSQERVAESAVRSFDKFGELES